MANKDYTQLPEYASKEEWLLDVRVKLESNTRRLADLREAGAGPHDGLVQILKREIRIAKKTLLAHAGTF